MIETIDKFLDEYNLKSADNTFLVGFSGGADSLCLLDVLHIFSQKYGFKLIALHLNHNWRGYESLEDELNCKSFCEKNEIEFISETLREDVPKSESAAREARYDFFLKHAKNYSNSAIFTAHTRTDNAETLIYRLIKGTGVQGLQGILPKRFVCGVPLYRPLLSVSRKEIEDYCNSKGLLANNDSSNFDINYKRNFIRHKIMPLFDEINFHSEKAINSLAELAISQTKIVDEYINLIMNDIYVDKKIVSEKFKMLSDDVMQKIIYDALLKLDLDYDRKKITDILEFIKNNLESKSGSRYSLTKDLWLFASSKYIYLITRTKAQENKNETTVSNEGEYEVLGTNFVFSIQKYSGKSDIKFPDEKEKIAYVNLENIGVDFTLRTRRDGDFITPFGMKGSMKLKKYLNSKRISLHERDGLILLAKGSEIFWVAGVGLSDKLKVVNEPTHVIELRNS